MGKVKNGNLGLSCTVADAETFAIYKALQTFESEILRKKAQIALPERPIPGLKLYIFIDSTAAIQQLQQQGLYTVQQVKQIAHQITAAGITISVT